MIKIKTIATLIALTALASCQMPFGNPAAKLLWAGRRFRLH
jgi:hypothetical protein